MIHKIITTLIATLLITSIVGPVAGLAAAQSQGGPSGMVATPAENVGPPDHAQGGGQGGDQGGPPDHVDVPENVPTHAAAWSVHSSQHAAALETTVGAIDGQLALVFTDDEHHDGRTVAIDATTLEDALGERPELAKVEHSSGETYEISIEYENGHALLELEEFSSNTVTFDGEVSIGGSESADGAQYSYNLSDASGVDNFSASFEGVMNREWSNSSGTVADGDSLAVGGGGNVEPTGPASGEPQVTVGAETAKASTGVDTSSSSTNWNDGQTETADIYVGPDGVVDEFGVYFYSDGTADFDVIVNGESAGSTSISAPSAGWHWGSIDPIKASSDNVSLEATKTNGHYSYERAGENGSAYYAMAVRGSPSGSLSVSGDDGSSASVSSLSDGATRTAGLDATTGLSSLSMSTGSAGRFDLLLEQELRTETVDPTLEVNGETASHSGTLADGEAVDLAVQESWLREGENRVNVSMDSPETGPTGQAGLEYSHTAPNDKSVEYSGETWSESYNITHSYAKDRADAQVTIPFASDRVVAIRSLERRVGGSWEDVPDDERTLDGSELTVELGAVDAGDDVGVRATGTKVRAVGGEIAVVEPTMLGEPLDTKIALESMGDGFGIYVNGTGRGDETHYTHAESWSNPQAFARFRTDGSQALKFPNAAEADVARLSTVDMGVTPEDGHADVRVLDAGDEPEVQLRESSDTDGVTFEWRETTSGHQYQLYSLDSELERDTATAESPVSLFSPGVPERLKIYDLGSASGGGDPGSVVGPTASRSFGANAAFIIGAAVAGLVVLFLAARRWGDSTISSSALFFVGAAVIVLVALQVLAPNVLADYLGRAIESAFPLLLLAGAAIGIVWLRQRGDDTSIIIQGGEK